MVDERWWVWVWVALGVKLFLAVRVRSWRRLASERVEWVDGSRVLKQRTKSSRSLVGPEFQWSS